MFIKAENEFELLKIPCIDSECLKDELINCLIENKLKAGNIIRKPIEGLLKYHQNLLK